MRRPLVICDCDEVLLHFVGPFADYLDRHHALTLKLDSFALSGNIVDAAGATIDAARVMPLLDGFFAGHMTTQTPTPGAVKALAALAERADIVILTNVADAHNGVRTSELARHGMPYRVLCNAGPKGEPVRRLIDEYRPSRAAFVDDLPPHHRSVKAAAPETFCLHMVADPQLRPLIPPSAEADARIDDWADALPRLQQALEIAA